MSATHNETTNYSGIAPRRGEIYYISTGTGSQDAIGSEQQAGRPALVVSNNTGNKYSQVFEVVYLTLQEKNPLPTHVPIPVDDGRTSTALCEQVDSVSIKRFQSYKCRVPEEYMQEVDKALAVSFALDYLYENINLLEERLKRCQDKTVTTDAPHTTPTGASSDDRIKELESTVKELTEHNHSLEQELKDLLAKESEANRQLNNYRALHLKRTDVGIASCATDTSSLQQDMIFYKRAYETLLDRIMHNHS